MGAVVNIQTVTRFATIDCCVCGVVFAVSETQDKIWREKGKEVRFFCPNGHGQSYTEGEIERVRREAQAAIEAAKRETQAALADMEWWRVRDGEKFKRISAMKGQMTKLRKRVGNGVCPCCQRTFSQLQRHMAHAHPDFKQPKAETETDQS